MTRRRATLPPMDHLPILVRVLDVISEQGNDADAVAAVLEREFPDPDELEMALDVYAATLGWLYVAPGGIAFLRETADYWRRQLQPAASGRRWGWRATG